MSAKHRADVIPKRLAWWQRKRAFTYQLEAWKLQLRDTIEELRDIAAELKEWKKND